MTQPPAARPAQFVAAASEGERTVLLDITGGHYYGLNTVAARVWFLICEGATSDRIVQTLATEYDVDAGQAADDVRTLLAEMAALQLITDSAPAAHPMPARVSEAAL